MDTIEKKEQNELERVSNGIESFEKRKEDLIKLADSAKILEVNSLDQKVEYKFVKEKRLEIMRARTSVEKEGKSIRDIITPISKMVSAKEKELVAIISGQEERLLVMERWYESEVEKKKIEADNLEKERIQERLNSLQKYGASLDYVIVLAMTDDQFEEKLSEVKIEWEKEQAIEVEKKRRIAVLIETGFSFDGNNYFISDFKRLDNVTISSLSNPEFEEIIKAGSFELKRIADEKQAELDKINKIKSEQEKEKKRLEDIAEEQNIKQKEIDDKLQKIKDQEEAKFAEEKRIEKENQDKIEEEKRKKEIEDAKKIAADEAIEEEKAKREKELKDKETAELKRIAKMPDKKKLIEWADKILDIPIPELKTEEGQQLLGSQQLLLKQLLTNIKKLADHL